MSDNIPSIDDLSDGSFIIVCSRNESESLVETADHDIKHILTDENYYQDTYYMSTSRFKEYISCPLKQSMIDINLWDKPEEKDALLVGNYTHSYFESPEAHNAFIELNKDKMISSRGKTAGQLKSEFKVADKMIATLEKESLFNLIYHGSDGDEVVKEQILTGTLGGIPFKCKIDSLNLSSNYFVDLKTMDTIYKEKYSTEIRSYTKGAVYNVLKYKYDLQMFIYQQLLYQNYGEVFTPYIIAVSKEVIPDKEIFRVDELTLDRGRQVFEDNIDYIADVFSGVVLEPGGCGQCDFCLTYKTLDTIIDLSNF